MIIESTRHDGIHRVISDNGKVIGKFHHLYNAVRFVERIEKAKKDIELTKPNQSMNLKKILANLDVIHGADEFEVLFWENGKEPVEIKNVLFDLETRSVLLTNFKHDKNKV